MTRSELNIQLSSKFPNLSAADIKSCVDHILENIGYGLLNGKRTEIRGFGTFSHRIRSSRAARNPKTGEGVIVPNKAVIHFKFSKYILQELHPN